MRLRGFISLQPPPAFGPQIFDRIKAQVLYSFHSKLAIEFSNCLVTALGALLKVQLPASLTFAPGFPWISRGFRSSFWETFAAAGKVGALNKSSIDWWSCGHLDCTSFFW